MPSLLCLALSNAVLATVLAVFAAILARFCRRPAVVHALWLLVLLKLITPPLLPVSVTWPRNEESEPPPVELLPESTPAIGAATVRERLEALLSDDGGSEDVGAATVEERLEMPLSDGRGSIFSMAIVAVWFGGAFIWWTIAAVRLWKFQRLLHRARLAPADVQEQARRLAALLRLRRCPPIVFVSAPLSPMLWALGLSPRLLVPTELWSKLTAEQQDTLLAHELAHLYRGDHWVRRLELLVLGLYWWHPVVWWARRRLQEAEEECCDALVVALLPDAAPSYASVLVETVAFLSQTRPTALVGTSGAGHVPLLKRRLTMILTETSSRKPSRVAFWTVLGLGALLLPLAPRAARTEGPEEPKKAETKDRTVDPFLAAWKNDNLHTHDVFKAKDCSSCHQAVAVHNENLHGKPQSWQHAHDEIVRLLDEIKTQRAKLQETEDRLKRALDALKKLQPRAESAGSRKQEQPYDVQPFQLQPFVRQSSWNVTWAEALFDRRSVDLAPVKQGTAGVTDIKYVMTNHGMYLIHIEDIRTSAACLSAVATKNELKPGETAAIEARLDRSKMAGRKHFEIYVQFDKPDRQQAVLEVRADVEAAAPAKPRSPERLQELEKKLDALRKEMEGLRREMRPDKDR